jgi:signal transduction histidine kinase
VSDTFAGLRRVPLFDGLSDDDLARICADTEDVTLEAGEVLFNEGDHGDRAYVITSGTVEIVKSGARRDAILALRKPGEVIGEMALIEAEPRIATARARTDVEMIGIPKHSLDDVLATSPRAARALFDTFLARMRATNDQLRQNERMAQLGTLTAGVAHELNNPAAGVARAAEVLAEQLDQLAELVVGSDGDSPRAVAVELARANRKPPTDGLARSDLEAELEDWLDAHDVPDAWSLAGSLADLGISPDELDSLGDLSESELTDVVRTVSITSSLRRLAAEIAEGSSRISTIVRGLKSYSYLDQSPVQDVDVHKGLEDTLAILGHKTKSIRVHRDFEEGLPTITALGTELNQVWTNLIDNACDALAGQTKPEPTIVIRTGRTGDMIRVEVEDNGLGIPEEIQDRIFDAFFTTKPPGQGTGLGLQISWRIVVLEHGGELSFTSMRGETTFRVTLPIEPPARP